MTWQEPPWYGPVCKVVWEEGRGDPASYSIQIESESYYVSDG